MKTLFMSDQYPCFCQALLQMEYSIIPSKNIDSVPIPERKHADMQLLRIKNTVFTLKDCIRQPGSSYPDNVLLNGLFLDGKLYGKMSAIDPVVFDYCAAERIPVVNVNQGYARCSTLIINEHAAITADPSIASALKNNGVEVLRISPGHILLEGYDYGFIGGLQISPGHILLEGYDYGFIGGAGFCDENSVFFFGDVSRHPDYQLIRDFCEKHHKTIRVICKENPLTDIGGVVEINHETELY